MNFQESTIRVTNFKEVSLGYTLEQAIEEANRCLECTNKPCMTGCPVGIDIPAFIHYLKIGDVLKAYDVLKTYTSLPAVCGRVCPQETQCEAKCVKGIKGEPVAIGALERFTADYVREMSKEYGRTKKELSKTDLDEERIDRLKVAVVGSGPAGLSCAGQLLEFGYDVTIFEALHEPGGVLRYGIPEFRLPKEIVDHEINTLVANGVTIEKNVVIGKTVDLADLEAEAYKSIFLGTGAGLPRFMDIPGENLLGVYSANEFLARINLMKAYETDSQTPVYIKDAVAVVGGGNVAMDAARCAKRMGAKNVYLIYRRSEEEMPARLEEIEHAKEEGIEFVLLTNPKEILGDENGFVKGIRCVSMVLGEQDDNGRRKPVEQTDSSHIINVDSVIISIGTVANPLVKDLGVELNKWGLIIVDDIGQTSICGVYAGGDVVSGAATVINAMGAGKACAKEIHKALNKS